MKWSASQSLRTLVALSFMASMPACGAAGEGSRSPTCTTGSCETEDVSAEGYCVEDRECGADERCVGGQCTTTVTNPSGACSENQDCPASMYCNTQSLRCVECLDEMHCDPGLVCRIDFTCGPAEGCIGDSQCAPLVCNTMSGACVECLVEADCDTGFTCHNLHCIENGEAPQCERQADCDPEGKICDASGRCVPCTATSQCGVDKVCTSGVCAPNLATVSSPMPGDLVLNEILADPALDNTSTTAVEGDANNDGLRDTFNDEFVEIVNQSGKTLDLTDCTLTVKTTLRHRFDPSIDPLTNLVPNHSAVVVFGGGAPNGSFGGAKIFTSSGGSLTLANDGAAVTLHCPGTTGTMQIDSVTYPTGGDDQSWNRAVDGDRATTLAQHLTLMANVPFSPGTCVSGESFPSCL